jgi:lysozyme
MDMQKLKKLITMQEGYRQFPYDDATGLSVQAPHGKITIGIGRNIQDKGIDITEADKMLEDDLNYLVPKLKAALPYFDNLGDVRQGVLVDIAFNLGFNGLMEFKNMLALIEQQKFHEASLELLNSKAANQLPRRYKDNATMLDAGEWVHV